MKFREVGMKTRLKGVKKLVFDKQLEAANNMFSKVFVIQDFSQTIFKRVISSQKLELSWSPDSTQPTLSTVCSLSAGIGVRLRTQRAMSAVRADGEPA